MRPLQVNQAQPSTSGRACNSSQSARLQPCGLLKLGLPKLKARGVQASQAINGEACACSPQPGPMHGQVRSSMQRGSTLAAPASHQQQQQHLLSPASASGKPGRQHRGARQRCAAAPPDGGWGPSDPPPRPAPRPPPPPPTPQQRAAAQQQQQQQDASQLNRLRNLMISMGMPMLGAAAIAADMAQGGGNKGSGAGAAAAGSRAGAPGGGAPGGGDGWGNGAAAAAAGAGAAAAAATAAAPPRIRAHEVNEWGSPWTEDWDPEENLDEEAMMALADEAEAQLRKQEGQETPRDKWITPLLDLTAVTGAVDPDQERTEDTLQGEALANKDESLTALRYGAQLLLVPMLTGFILSRALADPVLNFTLQNNPDAFAMTDRQQVEGAQKVHIEEARVRFDMAIGKLPPLSEEQILEHLREFAEEVQEEERQANEQNLLTVVSDSISSIVLFAMLAQKSRGRTAIFNTMARLFDGLSDIAKAVLIILVADTLLGYHSEEGWTGLIELVLGHYGFEAEEEGIIIFVGVVPVVIDVLFKYWIFIGLNKISPGAVVTIKQIDTH